MLYRVINENRQAIAARVRDRSAQRGSRCVENGELQEGVLLFLSQLSDLLFLRHADATRSDMEERREIARAGAEHGRRLHQHGLSAAHAVHDYGDIGRTLMEIAAQKALVFSSEDYETLSLCVDAAVAGAVNEHARAQDRARRERGLAESAPPPADVWERMPTPRPQVPGRGVAWADGPAGNRTESRSR